MESMQKRDSMPRALPGGSASGTLRSPSKQAASDKNAAEINKIKTDYKRYLKAFTKEMKKRGYKVN